MATWKVQQLTGASKGQTGWAQLVECKPAQTPPSALTPAVQRRPVAGARRLNPRRIHGARLAIASTVRSERRIAV